VIKKTATLNDVIPAKAGIHFDLASNGMAQREAEKNAVIPAKAGIHLDLQDMAAWKR